MRISRLLVATWAPLWILACTSRQPNVDSPTQIPLEIRLAATEPQPGFRAMVLAETSDSIYAASEVLRAILWDERNKDEFLYEGSYWKKGYVGDSYQFLKDEGMGGRNLDARTHFYYFATVNTPAMAMKLVGAGSQYAWGYLDANGDYLDEGKTYKLNIPKDAPAEKFWSVCVYDPQTRSMLQTDQTFPSKQSQRDKLIANDDGSFDLYFGPKAPAGKEANWTQTVPGKGWFCLLRLYSPTEAWFDKTWRPGEIELVK